MFGKKQSPAMALMSAFEKALDAKGIKYSDSQENSVVRCVYGGDNFKSLTFTFIFDEDGRSVAIRVFSIEKFSAQQLPDAYEFCNRMNMQYRWLHFYVDSDNELTAAMDASVTEATVGAVGCELLSRSVSITDDVCKELHS